MLFRLFDTVLFFTLKSEAKIRLENCFFTFEHKSKKSSKSQEESIKPLGVNSSFMEGVNL